jgi:hypothetical protein
VPWQRDRWIARYPRLSCQFEALPARLSRAVLRENALQAPETAGGMFDTMIATYAWGWSTTHVGVSRAARVLNAGADQVGPHLLAARSRMLADGPVAGYWSLAREHHVHGLGPSFGTKFLFFCSADEDRALILDNLLANWLRRHHRLEVAAGRYVKKDYKTYLAAMRRWATDLGIAAHELEALIFTDEATRRNLPGWGGTSPR